MDNTMNQPFSGDTYLAEIILELKSKFNLKTAIETGTYKGVTTLWLNQHFEDVHTSEVDATLYPYIRNEFANTNIKLWTASSELALPEILNYIKDDKPFVFLDAHWYKNPLLPELKAIANKGIKPVIAIHDFKVPHNPELGYDVYPNQNIVYDFNYIKSSIENIYGSDGYEYFYNSKATGAKRGCIFIYPK